MVASAPKFGFFLSPKKPTAAPDSRMLSGISVWRNWIASKRDSEAVERPLIESDIAGRPLYGGDRMAA